MNVSVVSNDSVYEVKNLSLQKGGILPEAKLVYKTIGTLNYYKDNVILIPAWFAGNHVDSEKLLTGTDRVLNPEKYFIILTNLLGGGLSSSPSNTRPPFNGPNFPRITIYDNVKFQYSLVKQVFGIDRIKLVAGWSMGAAQAYQWAAYYPDMVESAVAFCGSARTAIYNKVFIDALTKTLRMTSADTLKNDGEVTDVRRLFASIYAGWGLSEPFYRLEYFKQMNANTYEEFIINFWEKNFLSHNIHDLLAVLQTWKDLDISDNELYHKDFDKALSSIKARMIVAPCEYDRYFPPVDSEYEVSRIKNVRLKLIPSYWGHMTLFNPEDRHYFDQAIGEVLQD